jgi:uncharacterized membrane protein YcgQ (UPF0703/DUF1980 family)
MAKKGQGNYKCIIRKWRVWGCFIYSGMFHKYTVKEYIVLKNFLNFFCRIVAIIQIVIWFLKNVRRSLSLTMNNVILRLQIKRYTMIFHIWSIFLFDLLSKYFQCRPRVICQQVLTPNVWINEVVKKYQLNGCPCKREASRIWNVTQEKNIWIF